MALDRKQLFKPEKKLRKLLKNLADQPTADEVHDLRTNTRRLEALLMSLRLDARTTEKKLLAALNPVRRRAGKVRDMDVLTGFASTLHSGDEHDCRVALLEYLGEKRYRQAKKLGKLLRSDGKKIRRQLKKTVAHLDRMFDGGSAQSVEDGATTDAAATSLRLSVELASPARLNAGNLHEYRKKVKELRYVLKFAKNADGNLVDALGEVKDAIGEWHDWTELQAVAEKALDHGQRCGLIHEIRAIAHDKFNHAFALTNRMRARYVETEQKTPAARRRRGGNLSRPVMTAASRLAA